MLNNAMNERETKRTRANQFVDIYITCVKRKIV